MYYFFFHKTPSMTLKRVIMILAASYEFYKGRNNEIVERPGDNEEVPAVSYFYSLPCNIRTLSFSTLFNRFSLFQLIKQITNLGAKNKEKPLCYVYSLKARALIHAHLTRMPLNPETLEKDRQYIVKKCPYLIQEMVTCVNQLILLAYARRSKFDTQKLFTYKNLA